MSVAKVNIFVKTVREDFSVNLPFDRGKLFADRKLKRYSKHLKLMKTLDF